MTTRWSDALSSDRAPQLLPFLFAATLFAGMVMQQRLLPTRQMALHLPSTVGVRPGAAPQESVAPEPLVSRAALPSPVLPTESVPTDAPMSAAEPSSGLMTLGVRRTSPTLGTAAAEPLVDHLPREIGPGDAAGNLKFRSRQPTPVSVVVASILQSLKRIHPTGPSRTKAAKSPPAGKPARSRGEHGWGMMATAPKMSLAGWTLGGAAPQHAILGGPAPFAARYAPTISGMTLRRPK